MTSDTSCRGGAEHRGGGTAADVRQPLLKPMRSGCAAVLGALMLAAAVPASAGTLAAWGDNSYGQLGDGSFTAHITARPVSRLSGVVDMHAGREHAVALKSDGTVWAWGRNDYGMVGDGTRQNRSAPVQVRGLSNVVAVATGHYHSMALKADGTVWCWGWNAYGQLGEVRLRSGPSPFRCTGSRVSSP